MSGVLLETAQKKNKPRECEGLAGVHWGVAAPKKKKKKACKCPFVESHLAGETLMKRLVACCSGWAHMQGGTDEFMQRWTKKINK